ncbi:MAG: MarR family transcriptional regulator [Actinomycetes bacterium]
MSTTTAPLASSALASLLRLAVMRLSRRLRAERADTGLTLTQLSTLATLDRMGATTPGSLAAHEKVRPPSMTRVLAGLEQAGLVVRTPHPSDGRQVVVQVSPEAVALLKADRRRREAWLARRLADLTAAERATLSDAATILDRLATQ